MGKVNDQGKHKLKECLGKEKPTAHYIVYCSIFCMHSYSQLHKLLESNTKISIWKKNKYPRSQLKTFLNLEFVSL